MNSLIKSASEIALMRESGKLLAKVFNELDSFMAPGITTLEIDSFDDHLTTAEKESAKRSFDPQI